MLLPLVIGGIAIFASVIGTFFVRGPKVMRALYHGDVERRQLVRIVACPDPRPVVGLSADAKAVHVQRVRVFAPSRQHGDLAHASQMTREEAPDDARPDDADPFHALRRVSQRGDMSVKQGCS